MTANIDDMLEQWAKWRLDDKRPQSAFGVSMLAKAMDSMPSAKCVPCSGRGRVPASKYGLKKNGWISCLNCNGKGKVKLDTDSAKSVRCSACKGAKEIENQFDGTRRTCTACSGRGRIVVKQINPAFIRAASSGPRHDFDDIQSERLDKMVCTILNEREKDVIELEYCWSQKIAGRSQAERGAKIGIKQQTYSDTLNMAKMKLAVAMIRMMEGEE